MAVGTESSTIFIHVIISLSLLLFASKIFAELFHRIKLPIVLGELLAGIVIGPYALGGLPLFNGEPLVILDETIKNIGELAAIVILFVAGLEITPREFLKRRSQFIYSRCTRCHCTFFCWLYYIFFIWFRSL